MCSISSLKLLFSNGSPVRYQFDIWKLTQGSLCFSILLIFTAKWKSSSWFESKRSVSNSNWFCSSLAHVDVERNLLDRIMLGLLDKKFPNVFFLCFCESWLLGLEYSWSIANFDVDYAFHHLFNGIKIFLSSFQLFFRKLFQ